MREPIQKVLVCDAQLHKKKDAFKSKTKWEGDSVFINPPYSRGQLREWAELASLQTGSSKGTREIIMLVPVDTSTQWFRTAVQDKDCFIALRTRLRFLDPKLNRSCKDSARFPSALLYFGPQPERFYKGLGYLGNVFQRIP